MGINFLTPTQTEEKTAEITESLTQLLHQIVHDVVQRLDCVGAIATTVENGRSLYVRATAFDVPDEIVENYLQNEGLSLIGPNAIVQLDKDKKNPQTQFFNQDGHAKPYVISERLFDLLRPLTGKKFSDRIQRDFGIEQVITIPFILREEVVGTLIVAKQKPFTTHEIDILTAFAHQTAATIRSERRLSSMAVLERIIFSMQSTMLDETKVLQTIVDTVVYELGYIGAMVATLEAGNSLPVRAYALDAMPKLLSTLESKAGIGLVGPRSVVFLDDERYKDNLSVRAVKGINGRPQNYIASDRLFDLFRPIADRSVSALAQRMLQIKQVIAVPFFLENEVVGNLFVASRKETFSDWEVSILTAFGQQAAAGLRNARLYHETEKQKQIAEMFSRMAFSATASIHALGNHLSSIHTYLQMLTTIREFPPEHQDMLLQNSDAILGRLDKASRLLDSLHEPWQQTTERPININDCINVAIREVFPEILQELREKTLQTESGVTLHIDLAFDLPVIHASSDMMTEAFRVLIKNAKEAMSSKKECTLSVRSYVQNSNVVVTIQDTGGGIKPENLQHIFEIGWSTKGNQGMGFGLFWTKDFIRGLDGTIQVGSDFGKGTTFTLTLPF